MEGVTLGDVLGTNVSILLERIVGIAVGEALGGAVGMLVLKSAF